MESRNGSILLVLVGWISLTFQPIDTLTTLCFTYLPLP
jgi:hypothetical protein